MKSIILTHNVSGKNVLINWEQVLFAAETENSFGETYTEIGYLSENAIPVKEKAEAIAALLKDVE